MSRFKERDYDLNIYRLELESSNPDKIRFSRVWRIQIFEVVDQSHHEVQRPIKLTSEEAKNLKLGYGYFDEQDHWYGLEGFVKDYGNLLTKRLIKIFNLLP